jgi:hypothetical protein
MIRNLKALLLAGMAVAAFGVVGASSAQAAEYHCSVEPCTITALPDGALNSKTAHHVFSFTLAGTTLSFTCGNAKTNFSGTATSNTKTTSSITLTNISYGHDAISAPPSCTVGGQLATVDMNGCDYEFTSDAAGTVHVRCPAGKEIQITFGACTIDIPTQTITGIAYTNFNNEVTVSTGNVKNIAGTATPGCPVSGAFTNGEYTTGNTLITGETHAGVMATVFYQ